VVLEIQSWCAVDVSSVGQKPKGEGIPKIRVQGENRPQA
jgi:hypothetical protein